MGAVQGWTRQKYCVLWLSPADFSYGVEVESVDEVRRRAGRKKKPNALVIRVTLAEIEPPIWRRVVVPKTITLHELHRTCQILFEWYDYHLYEFSVDGVRFEAPHAEAEGRDAKKAKLSGLGIGPGDRFTYVYDWGDYWVHEIEVEEETVGDPSWLPWLLDGERAGPPEDCGGIGGYYDLQRAVAMTEEEAEADFEILRMREWVGEDYDADAFDQRGVRHALLLSSAWGSLRRGH